jgi:hypothetical protein
MKFLTLIFLCLLVGCASTPVPVPQKFPPPYTVGVKKETPKCPPLQQQTGENVNILELLKTIVANYTEYYICSDHVDNWNKWYIEQKEIFEKVKK